MWIQNSERIWWDKAEKVTEAFIILYIFFKKYKLNPESSDVPVKGFKHGSDIKHILDQLGGQLIKTKLDSKFI